MKIEISTVNEMIEARIKILSRQITRIQEDERILLDRNQQIKERMTVIKELHELQEDLREIERMG